MTYPHRRDDPDGTTWVWQTRLGISHLIAEHELQLVDERRRWVRRERYDGGGWVARDAAELPIPLDEDSAERIVQDLVERESGG